VNDRRNETSADAMVRLKAEQKTYQDVLDAVILPALTALERRADDHEVVVRRAPLTRDPVLVVKAKRGRFHRSPPKLTFGPYGLGSGAGAVQASRSIFRRDYAIEKAVTIPLDDTNSEAIRQVAEDFIEAVVREMKPLARPARSRP
jgi:hypothetical protein